MNKAPPAASPDAYVEALAGWRRALVGRLRASVLAAGKLDERIKWGHLVYFFNGPVLLIRAEEKRVLFGFWRGKRLADLDERLKPGGKYEMATIALVQGDTISAAQAKRLTKAAVELNRKLGDPTAVTPSSRTRESRTARAPRGHASTGRRGRSKDGAGPAHVERLREVAMRLPDVEDATTARGIAFTVRGRLIACAAIHASAEPGSLVVRISPEQRAPLMAAYSRALYLTDHYAKHPAVLARLALLDRDALRDILGAAWLHVAEKTAQSGKRSTSGRKR